MACKADLRRRYLAARAALAPAERTAADAEIRRRIEALPEFADCRAVAIFATDGTEPDLLPLLAAHPEKIFLLPRYAAARRIYELAPVRSAAELTVARYGLLEPPATATAAPEELVRKATLHLTPAVAGDRRGVRLGRGGGFYDRLLVGVESPVCGVFYACQLAAEELPEEAHDRRLELAVTEREVLDFRS